MKKTPVSKIRRKVSEDMKSEYHFDYRKARPNRFSNKNIERRLVVVLDPDIAKIFKTPQSVNKALRALITAVPIATTE
jgi:hypothetical protein